MQVTVVDRFPGLFFGVSKVITVIDSDEVEPTVDEYVANVFMFADDSLDGFARSSDDGEQPEGVVLVSRTIVDRLPWQSSHQIAVVTGEDAKATDDVVYRFVSTAEVCRVHCRSEVLHIDHMRDDERSGHDLFQHGKLWIIAIIVAV